MAFPAWLAVIVQLPAPVSVTVLPRTVHDPDAVKLTASPEEAVALTTNGASPKVLFAKAPKVMDWFALFTVVTAVAELLVVKGSGSFAETVAVFEKDPTVVGVTTIITVALAPFAKLPKEQLTDVQVPWLGVADSNVTPTGNGSLSVTPVAAYGSALETVRV